MRIPVYDILLPQKIENREINCKFKDFEDSLMPRGNPYYLYRDKGVYALIQ